jgi:FdhD protein
VSATTEVPIVAVRGGRAEQAADRLAVEAPLELRVRQGDDERALSITMRTPGHDDELAVGYLYCEGVLRDRAQVAAVETSGDVVVVRLAAGAEVALDRVARALPTTSACGVCGKGSLDLIGGRPPAPLAPGAPALSPQVVHGLPAALRRAQAAFAATGGLHAAGLFDAAGALRLAREDVGRHNAVDKLIGRLFLDGALPADDAVLMVSGRASFELVQKAAAAGIPVLAAVGAPSSLAASLASDAGMTLLGFVRDERFNVYAGADRVMGASR